MRYRHDRPGLAAVCAFLALWPATGARAGMDLANLSGSDRAVLNRILIEALADMPDILNDPRIGRPVSAAATNAYADAVAGDLARIEAHGEALFAPTLPGFGLPDATRVLALFVRDGCLDCARAEADLRALARIRHLRVTLIDIDRNRALADALDLDTAPSYVFPDMMVRGHVPPIVLEKYLDD